MKKILSVIAIGIISFSLCASATTYNITPKAPKISESLKPIITKYKQGDYIGSMVDLEELIKIEKNNTYAKYYLALCYTQLGYREEANILYREVAQKNDNLALSHYSQRALECLDNPDNQTCNPELQKTKNSEPMTDMDLFIQSGKTFHPSAMDRITKERMERKLIQEEQIRNQQKASVNGEKTSYTQPTNEEIANALNTLSKIGMNPYGQFNPLAQAQQFQQYGAMGLNNPMMYMMGNSNPDIAKMFLYSQMQQQNNMLNYGI